MRVHGYDDKPERLRAMLDQRRAEAAEQKLSADVIEKHCVEWVQHRRRVRHPPRLTRDKISRFWKTI